ncbi:hypothetical protein L198_05538 [Cryptococcus wingfieldii CBS 7118]|uniref:Uncharacterized protein n=1 Tax=Cryptococcus wingfieldii CBS 7118 TaxID=1295528 RepID=A0A1E3IVU6_9TREE|nr:hypothetical protein L198_05538 [Cryptococcus wingfieldii CBS 7118]ODN92744.1 hypothetical protein L198_05538 [Cryptococcus wingfieldii CBS 7118]
MGVLNYTQNKPKDMSRGYLEACNYSKDAQFDFHDRSPRIQALRGPAAALYHAKLKHERQTRWYELQKQKALQKKALEAERVKAGGRAAVPAGEEGKKRGKTDDDSGGRSGGKTDYGDRWKNSGSGGFHFNHSEYDLRDWALERESR